MKQRHIDDLAAAARGAADEIAYRGETQADAAKSETVGAVYRARGPGGVLPERWSDGRVAGEINRALEGSGSDVLATAFEQSYPDLPIGVIVRLGPHAYSPFIFGRQWFEGGSPTISAGCLYDTHTEFAAPEGAIIRIGDSCYETDRGLGVRLCTACVQTLARACIPPQYQPEHDLDLQDALYTVGAVLDPVWEVGIADLCHERGPAAQESVHVPWETGTNAVPPDELRPAPAERSARAPNMQSLLKTLHPATRHQRLWIDHGGMTRPRDTFRVGLLPTCDEGEQSVEWIGVS